MAPWRNSTEKPALYHVVTRMVERLGVLYSDVFVAGVAKELEDARKEGEEAMAAEIHQRFTYRMHDLGQFMKGLLQRFSQWFNGQHQRTGTLWEQRFKSVIVESGTAARTIAAYIDLNPVRAGMVSDPGDYRWSGYGEAVGGGKKGNGKKPREGLVRACMSHKGVGFEVENWKFPGSTAGRWEWRWGEKLQTSSKRKTSVNMNEEEMLSSEDNEPAIQHFQLLS